MGGRGRCAEAGCWRMPGAARLRAHANTSKRLRASCGCACIRYAWAGLGPPRLEAAPAAPPRPCKDGRAADFVRSLNDMRESADFSGSDRITNDYTLEGPDDANRQLVEGALSTFADYIRAETLSKGLVVGAPPEGAYAQDEQVGSTLLKLALNR